MLSLGLWITLSQPLSACRYTVRDMGFVDLGDEPYSLFILVSDTMAEEAILEINEVAQEAVAGTNIRTEIVNIDTQVDHPVLKHFSPHTSPWLPVLVLFSPEGRFLELPQPARPFRQALWSILEPVSSSPKRREIIEKVSRGLGIVLIVEGPDSTANKRAIQDAEAAINKITSLMDTFPKVVFGPPELVILKREVFDKEESLLWSLGLEADKVDQQVAVVLYGRVRRLGPVLKGEDITELRLTNLLGIAGADCECGLDRAWLQNPTLPAKWKKSEEAKLVERLGFDPENPLVKIEMHDILRRGMNSGVDRLDPDLVDVLASGYSYTEIELTAGNLVDPFVQIDVATGEPTSIELQADGASEPDRPIFSPDRSAHIENSEKRAVQPEWITPEAGIAGMSLPSDYTTRAAETEKPHTPESRPPFLFRPAAILFVPGFIVFFVGLTIVIRASRAKK